MKNATMQEPSYKLKIEYDDIPINPRTDYDNFGKMVCWHSRYDLGDKHDFSEPDEFLKQLVRDSLSADEVINFVKKGGCNSVKLEYDRHNREWALKEYSEYFNKWFTEYTFFPKTLKGSDMVKESILDCLSIDALKELADKNNVIIPLYLYDHSGITISCTHSYPYNDRWDAGQVGWIYASYDDIQKEFSGVNAETLEKANDILIGETSAYNCYLCGECYGYTIEKNGVEVESCWGYLGDLREMVSEMKADVDKEYQHLFDHIDYGCMEYFEDESTRRAAQEKPSVRKQLTALKSQPNNTIPPERAPAHTSLEL